MASFSASAAIHASVCCFLFLAPPLQTTENSEIPKRLRDNGRTYKLVWYRFNKNLPDISSQQPNSGVKSRTVLIVPKTIQIDSKRADSNKQMVWQPAPKIRLESDLKSPNLVVTQGGFPPPPPKPKPKEFVAPAEKRAAIQAPKDLPLPPKIADPSLAAAKISGTPLALAPKPKPKAFLAPEVRAPAAEPVAQAMLPAPPVLAESPKLTVPEGAPSSVLDAPRPQPRRFVPPSLKGPGSGGGQPAGAMDAPPAVANGGAAVPALPDVLTATSGAGMGVGPKPGTGTGETTLAVIGVSPDTDQGKLPDGSRAAQLSTGGPQGTGGAGEVQTAGIIIPNVMVRGNGVNREGKSTLPASPPDARGGVEGARGVPSPGRMATQTLLSAALRPNARRVPALVEARFPGRVLYSSVLDTTQGQWQIWFAELNRQNSDAPAMWAPLPVTRTLNADWILSIPRMPGQRMQVAAIVRSDGSIDSIVGLQGVTGGSLQMIAEAMRQVRFTPAMRFGTAVDVDMILDIPLVAAPNLVRKSAP
jgi:hypothetical protein